MEIDNSQFFLDVFEGRGKESDLDARVERSSGFTTRIFRYDGTMVVKTGS